MRLMRPKFKRLLQLSGLGLLILALAVGGYVLCLLATDNFHVVVAGQVYRSGQMNAEGFTHAIEQYHIKSILNLRGENPTTPWHQAEIATAAKLNVIHYDCTLSSGTPLTLEQMEALVHLLREAPRPVLIHCQGGADRSGLVSALDRYAVEHQSPREADKELSIWYGHVPLVRPKVTAMDDSFWRYVSNHVSHGELKLQPRPTGP